MARRELGPAALAVAQAVAAALAAESGPVVVACSGGADSLALAAGTAWAARRLPVSPLAVVVDHGLQAGSVEVAARAAEQCRGLGLAAEVARVEVGNEGGPEAAAREARYAALAARPGPILLGHTLDDQAETVLLGLARGSGTRSLAGMAPRRGRLVRPLLGLRRATTVAACAEWELEAWADPHNADEHFARVRARGLLPAIEAALGPGVAESLARTADLARGDADLLDELAAAVATAPELSVGTVVALPAALRTRVLARWLRERGAVDLGQAHVVACDRLLTDWRGQGPVDVPGLRVSRESGALVAERR